MLVLRCGFLLISKEKQKQTSYVHYVGYLNFINDLIKHVPLLILVHVRLLFCSNCQLHALLLLKTTILFTKGTALTIFGRLKIPINLNLNKFSINLNLKTLRLLNCLHMSTYVFSTLYTTLPHHLIKDKLIDLINRTFIRENTQYACNEE